MDILYITPSLPLPVSGGRTRLFNLIKQLGGRHDVTVLSLIQPAEPDMLPGLEPYCRRIEVVPWEGFEPLGRWRNRLRGWGHLLFSRRPPYVQTFPVEKMRSALRKPLQLEEFDVVVFEQLFLVELLDEVETSGIPAMLVEQNVESDVARQRYAGAGNPVHKVRDWLAWRRLLAFEQRWVERFPVCIAVSERDAALLRRMSPTTQVHVVPNGVDTTAFAEPSSRREPDTLLFFGSLSYGPNADGLIWFCREIWPRLLKERPALKLEIVGINPPPRVLALEQHAGVHVTGFVPDIRDKLWSATLSVVPLRVGGGTRLKVLESLAAGCPVVSTTLGAEGLDLRDGEHMLIADTPADFALAVLALLADKELARSIADAGRWQVTQKYDWGHVAQLLESVCMQAVEEFASHAL